MLARTQDDELDTGPRQGGPERLCVATREVKPAAEMIRFVVGPDGSVVPDLKQKLPGRGVWVTGTRAALEEAVKRRAFARGFKREVQVDPNLVATTENLLRRATLDALAMAGKSALVPSGFSKVETALIRDHVVALIHAADAGRDGVRKLAAALRRQYGAEADQVASIEAFTSEELGLALGRANVIHAALLAGPASKTVLARYRRYEHFRTASSDHHHRDTERK